MPIRTPIDHSSSWRLTRSRFAEVEAVIQGGSHLRIKRNRRTNPPAPCRARHDRRRGGDPSKWESFQRLGLSPFFNYQEGTPTHSNHQNRSISFALNYHHAMTGTSVPGYISREQRG